MLLPTVLQQAVSVLSKNLTSKRTLVFAAAKRVPEKHAVREFC